MLLVLLRRGRAEVVLSRLSGFLQYLGKEEELLERALAHGHRQREAGRRRHPSAAAGGGDAAGSPQELQAIRVRVQEDPGDERGDAPVEVEAEVARGVADQDPRLDEESLERVDAGPSAGHSQDSAQGSGCAGSRAPQDLYLALLLIRPLEADDPALARPR